MTWVRACETGDIEPGEGMCVKIEGQARIALWNIDGEFVATADTCTHEEASLAEDGYLEDTVIECGLHMARYDARTGAALSFPAESDLQTFATKVEDGEVYVEVDG